MLTLHDPYSHGVSNASSLLIEMLRAQIGGKHTKLQGGNTHGKCGMRGVKDKSLGKKWSRLLKGWKIFSKQRKIFN
jgi:hypothetical protein